MPFMLFYFFCQGKLLFKSVSSVITMFHNLSTAGRVTVKV